MTATEWLNLLPLPQLPTPPLRCSEQQLPLHAFPGQLRKAGEQKLHFVKAEEGLLLRGCKCRGRFQEGAGEGQQGEHAASSLQAHWLGPRNNMVTAHTQQPRGLEVSFPFSIKRSFCHLKDKMKAHHGLCTRRPATLIEARHLNGRV